MTVGRHGGRDTVIRKPSTETRAAAGPHAVGHSTGLVLVAPDPASGPFSFRVDADGQVTEGCGWGFAGPTADLVASLLNPPPSPVALHTVAVDAPTPEAFLTLRQLIEEHDRRYAGGQVWAAGVHPEVERWVRAGCPEPDLVAVPTDEELAEAGVVTQPAPTSAMNDRRDGSKCRVQRLGAGR